MFISNDEKENMRISIRTLTAQVDHLLEEVKNLKAKKPVKAVKQKKAKAFIVRTAEAPWGYKLNGMPKSRPGRAPLPQPETKNEQPVPV
jgi:hypothetical protein